MTCKPHSYSADYVEDDDAPFVRFVWACGAVAVLQNWPPRLSLELEERLHDLAHQEAQS